MSAEVTLKRLGREVVGPAFCTFIHRVIERSQTLGIGRLHFLAREGHVFQRLYDELTPKLGPPLPTSYVYVSRLSTALAAIHGFGLRELRLVARRGARTPRSLIETFGLDERPLLPCLFAAGFSRVDEPIHDWWSETRLDRLLDDPLFQERVEEQARRARGLLRRYLEQEGYFAGDRIGLVDVGWSGTIQDALERAFRDGSPYVRGFYFGLRDGAASPGDHAAYESKEGLFTDFRRHPSVEQRALFSFVELFEQSARAPHGTTLGYDERDGRVVPRLNERSVGRDKERDSEPLNHALQEGIYEAAVEYAAAPPRWAQDRQEAAWRAIDRLVFLPTAAEIEAVSSLAHTVDWGDDAHKSILGDIAFSPKKLLHEFNVTTWRAAFLRRVGGPILPLVYRRYFARRT